MDRCMEVAHTHLKSRKPIILLYSLAPPIKFIDLLGTDQGVVDDSVGSTASSLRFSTFVLYDAEEWYEKITMLSLKNKKIIMLSVTYWMKKTECDVTNEMIFNCSVERAYFVAFKFKLFWLGKSIVTHWVFQRVRLVLHKNQANISAWRI
ncbi:hypothetical protein EJB05_14025 [Eragrostis curvula]|uniref:Uncharacterized protein n=1 Tax=Eragrostis curvula TaxID=38414 RepID=A0A5J9VXB2_9POAL|nr:hypothetical protein EJB05_14025 [Eragrostis curvula]